MKSTIQLFGWATTATLVLLTITFTSCNRERHWEAQVPGIDSLSGSEVFLWVQYSLPRNDNYVFCGLAIGTNENPTESQSVYEKQYLDSDEDLIHIEGLISQTEYHARAYIRPNGSSETIYSDNFDFSTLSLPELPCETDPGVITFDGSNYDMTNLSTYTAGAYYEMSASGSFGNIDFEFAEEPVTGIYKTVSYVPSSSTYVVKASCFVDPFFSCGFEAQVEQDIYVLNEGSGEIRISFCDLEIIPSGGGCIQTYEASGEVHE